MDAIHYQQFKTIYQTTFNSLEEIMGASCLVSIIGYLAAAMFNDHIVSVSPLFWIILGIGISINFRTRRRILKFKQVRLKCQEHIKIYTKY